MKVKNHCYLPAVALENHTANTEVQKNTYSLFSNSEG